MHSLISIKLYLPQMQVLYFSNFLNFIFIFHFSILLTAFMWYSACFYIGIYLCLHGQLTLSFGADAFCLRCGSGALRKRRRVRAALLINCRELTIGSVKEVHQERTHFNSLHSIRSLVVFCDLKILLGLGQEYT